MDAVPIYNVNPASGSSFNGWEAMALLNNRNNNGFGDCAGGGWWFWIVILMLFGWGGFGGGWGGGRGGMPNANGGTDSLGIDLAIRDAATNADLRSLSTFNSQANAQQINLIGQTKDLIASGFANVNNGLTQLGYQTQLGQRDIQSALQSCCCQTQQNIAGVNYNLATTGAAITNAINSNGAAINNNITNQAAQLNYNSAMQTCELKQAIAAEGQATRALIQAQYTADIERKLAEAKQQLFVLDKFGQYANGSSCPCSNGCNC